MEDVRRAFPSIRNPIGLYVLEKYGLPQGLVHYIQGFCDQLEHSFGANGAVAAENAHPEVGGLQGCPLTCLIMGAIMSVWVMAMKEVPDVETKVFVDDRIVTTTSQSPDETLAAASVKSGEVDAALGLERHPDKRQAASSSRRDAAY